MSSSVLKVLSELGQGDDKALLIELPKELLENIDVSSDGSVDTMQLLKLLRRAAITELQDKASKVESEDEALSRKAHLMNMIFNPDVAVDND